MLFPKKHLTQLTEDKAMRATTPDDVMNATAQMIDRIEKAHLGELCLQLFFDEEGSHLHPEVIARMRNNPNGIARLVDETMRRTQISIASQFGLYFSQSTRFLLLVAEELKVHSRQMKREIMGDWPIEWGMRHDPTKDSRVSDRRVDEFLDAKYKNERLFLQALTKNRLDDAQQFLNVIALLRKNGSDVPMQVELHNWEMELAVRMGDIELFLTAFRSFPDEANAVVDQLAGQLAQLVRDGMGTIVMVAPSPYALAQAQQTHRDPRVLLEEQVQSLTLTAMRDLARELIETVSMNVE